MAATTTTALVTISNRFSLIWADGLKGLVVSIITAALTLIYQGLSTTPVSINWGQVGIASATTGVAYLLKNFFSNTVTLATPPATATQAAGLTTTPSLTPKS